MSRALEEFKDIYSDFIDRNHSAIVDGYWHLKENRQKFNTKEEDFKHIQNTTEGVLEALQILIETVEGDRDKPGVQPYINQVVKTINIHLDRISKYYPKNKPSGFRTKESKREETKFQQLVFKGEQKIRSKIRDLNISNNMELLEINFFDNVVATLPMKDILCERDVKISAKCESLNVDWDLIIDNRMFINMEKRDIPDYNTEKHFWDQEIETLQFYISEWNKIKKGIDIDGYHMSPWMYFHLNFFKTPIKNQGNKIINPPLRDNEWYFDEIKKYAKKESKKLNSAASILYGTRRFSKTTSESSHIHHGVLIYSTETGTMSSTNNKDLTSMIDKMKKSLYNIHPAFKLNILSGKGFEDEVLFGIKSKSGRTSYEHFMLSVINTDGGSKKGGQKTAGGNPKVYVVDEIGKDKFLKAHRAAVPSFESDNGWECLPLYTGTAGEEDLSKDAETVLRNPKKNDFIEMDWDILEYGIPKEHITWKRRPFGWFLPAQMSIKTGHKKIETNLADFLNIDSEELRKIKFFKTDWENNTKVILEKRSKLSGDDLQQEIVFRPIDPEECFLSAKKNPFPAQATKKHKERLISEFGENGTARPIELYRDISNPEIITYEISNKEIATYPNLGGFIDAPFLLFGDFPEEKPQRFRYVGGFDDYKQEQSEGDSICGFYIFDRLTRKIVLSLASRPDPHSSLYTQIHMALDAFNAVCFPENEDMDIKKYFDRLHMSDYYLGQGFDVMSQFHITTTGKRKYGWQPDKNTAPFVRGLVVEYAKEQTDILDDEGNVIATQMGLERIEDIQLLDEITNYKEGGNFDRIVGFGSALLYDHYLTAKYIVPSSKPQIKKDEQEKSKPIKNKYFRKGRNLWKN